MAELEKSDILRAMDGPGDGGKDPDPIWEWSDAPAPREEADEPKDGRLRRRALHSRREAASTVPPSAPPSPNPTSAPAPSEERAGDLWGALTAATQRIERLSEETGALRIDMDKQFADLAKALSGYQEQPGPGVNDAVAQAVESTRTELAARFQADLENLTATISDALAQVATHLEQVSLLCGENRDSVEVATEEIQALSGRLNALQAPPPADLQPLSDTYARLADLVEVLARRVG